MIPPIARPQLPDELPLPEPSLMVVEKRPAVDAREIEGDEGKRIVIGAHMPQQRPIGGSAIALAASAVDTIGVVVGAASRVPIKFCAIHEDAILALGFGHPGE